MGTGPVPVDVAVREAKARRDRDRLDTIVRYAYGRGCRTHFIFAYFAGSARGGAEPRCGTCDVCLGWRRGAGRPLSDEEFEQVRIALSGVGRLAGRFGVERIAQVLTGSGARDVTSRGLDRIPTYGRLAALGSDRVKDLLGVLADAGLLERRGLEGGRPGMFVLALSETGRRVALGQERPELPMPGDARKPSRGKRRGAARGSAAGGEDVPLSAADATLLGQLKVWRREEAARRAVPAYVVFPDRTLAAIAALRPRNRDALLSVQGIGPAKLELYGAALLELVSGT
jgi:ATP-dependent DNA helicase RecQ